MNGLRMVRFLLTAYGAVGCVIYLIGQSTLAMFLTVGCLAGAGLCTILEDSIR